MAEETVAQGVVADGHGLVLFVPAIANPAAPTVTELSAVGVKKLTYSLTPDGFAHDTSVATVTSGRWTLAQALEYDGIITDTVEVTYVYTNTESDVARLTLTPGIEGFIVKRLAIENGEAIVADQIVTVLPIKASIQRDVPPTQNSELAKIQKLNITGKVQRDVKVVAGS